MKRILSIDLLKILAILGVIVIHTYEKALSQTSYDILGHPFIFLVERSARFAVPLFFIISGYLLFHRYSKQYSLKEFYWKRCIRLLIPYLIWSTIYIFLLEKAKVHDLSLPLIINNYIMGSASIQLYFIPSILILYFLFPLLQRITNKITIQVFFVLSIVEIALLYIDYFIMPLPLYYPLRTALLNMYPFILGMLTVKYQNEISLLVKKYYYLLLGLLLTTLYILYFQTRYDALKYHSIYYIDSQWQPFIFLYAIVLWFLLVLKDNLERFKKKLIFFSQLTFFVFFIHVIYLNLFWRIIGSYLLNETTGEIVKTLWFTPLSLMFVLVASYGTAYIIRFIPKVNNLLGIE
jgi:surface polysaccharide O-acyltransferase-like enzyme